ncbi:unnamed protein product [Cylindrotheca closterium]|uniref:Uncharacterized protein n=1 Tax=Cylindrotheca closterium TaxID=2856 RepID=A0AAD2PV74_9STRA|nr:unnamed protein product [Cylindrotheca closterium]
MVPIVTLQQNVLKPPACEDRFSTRISGSDDIPLPCHRQASTVGDDASSTHQKRVHFNRKQNSHDNICRDDYTDEELAACWVTQEERASHYKCFEKTIKRMESGKKANKDNTYRGLEDFLQTDSIDRTVHDCIDAVMDEQKRQWDISFKVIEWDLFREVSREVSTQSAKYSLAMAQYDAHETCAANIAEEDDDSFEGDDFPKGAAEIPQSFKDNANCKHFWHPKKLRSHMQPSS